MLLCKQHEEQVKAAAVAAGLEIAKDENEANEWLESGKGCGFRAAMGAIIVKAMEVWGAMTILSPKCPFCLIVTTIENCKCGKEHSVEEGHEMTRTWTKRAIECVQEMQARRAAAENPSNAPGSGTIQ